jgi:predicted AAA+ superfamily ATPase
VSRHRRGLRRRSRSRSDSPGLEIAASDTIEPTTKLLIVDEIQDVPPALTPMKYFQEKRPDVHLAAAGSLLGLALRTDVSFPVGKINFLDLQLGLRRVLGEVSPPPFVA